MERCAPATTSIPLEHVLPTIGSPVMTEFEHWMCASSGVDSANNNQSKREKRLCGRHLHDEISRIICLCKCHTSSSNAMSDCRASVFKLRYSSHFTHCQQFSVCVTAWNANERTRKVLVLCDRYFFTTIQFLVSFLFCWLFAWMIVGFHDGEVPYYRIIIITIQHNTSWN